MTQLARVPSGPSGLAVPHTNDDIKIFDTQTGEFRESAERVDVIATISLGYKNDKGYPVATQESHERWLHAHDADDAPALLQALADGNHRRLTISLASDVWGEFCQQHPAAYTKTKLKIYGDDKVLYYIGARKVIDPKTKEPVVNDKDEPLFEPVHLPFYRDKNPEEYASLLKETKNQISIYFYLAEWTEMPDGSWIPQVVMDGDTGIYRLRTTSAHSVENLASTVKQIRAQTGGFIKGVPLTLSVGFPEVSVPDGSKRKVPVCTFRLQPPYKITGVNFAPMLAAAVNEGQMLALPAPAVETMEREERTAPVMSEAVTDREREIDLIARGGRCPVGRYTRIFFSMAHGTDLDGDESPARARLVSTYTNGQTDSLSCLLNWSTDEEAQKFIAHVDELLNGPDDPEPERPRMRNDEYKRLYDPSYQEPVAPAPSIRQRQQTQPDGSVVDTATGEVIQAAPSDQEQPGQIIEAESREVPTEETEPAAPDPEIDDVEKLFPSAPPYAETAQAAPEPESKPRQSRRQQEAAASGLCTDPECLESGRPAKAMEGTDPPRCFGHAEEKEAAPIGV